MKNIKSIKGFTLIELLIVVAIIGIVVTLAFGNGGLFQTDAEKFETCLVESTFISRNNREDYCINKIMEDKRNTAIILSGG